MEFHAILFKNQLRAPGKNNLAVHRPAGEENQARCIGVVQRQQRAQTRERGEKRDNVSIAYTNL